MNAVADAPRSATANTNGESFMSASVSGPYEPVAEYGFQNGLSPVEIASCMNLVAGTSCQTRAPMSRTLAAGLRPCGFG